MRERRRPEAAGSPKPTLTSVISDISKLSEEEVEAKGGSALVKLDQAMRAAVAEHTKTKNAGMPMTVKQAERAVEMTAEEDKQGAQAPMLPLPSNVMALPSADRREKLRIVEALLFAAPEPLKETELAQHFGQGEDVKALLEELQGLYAGRGVNLVRVAGKWAFRTADDLSFLLERQAVEQRRLSRAALETLAIIAYHQPVTRAEIEEIRGVSLSKGTLDNLFEAGWIRPRGRRKTPGRPMTWGTSDAFLDHFGLESLKDLPGVDELKAAGLLDARPAIDAYRASPDAAGNGAKGEEESAPQGEADAEEEDLVLSSDEIPAEPLDPDDGTGRAEPHGGG